MANVTKEIAITLENRAGTLAEALNPIKEAGINLTAICASEEGDKNKVFLISNDNEKAAGILKNAGYSISIGEATTVSLPHKSGALASLALKLGGAKINIKHLYISAAGGEALAVFATDNNQKAAKVLG